MNILENDIKLIWITKKDVYDIIIRQIIQYSVKLHYKSYY